MAAEKLSFFILIILFILIYLILIKIALFSGPEISGARPVLVTFEHFKVNANLFSP